MAQPPFDDVAALIRSLREARTTARDALNERKAIEARLAAAKDQGPFPFPFPHQGSQLVEEMLRMMDEDEEYRYVTASPRYLDGHFIVTTANVNEYQARLFGPLPHEDMRRIFVAYVRRLEREGVDCRHYRTTMRYNYEQGDDASTGYRLEVPLDYLRRKGGMDG